MVLPVPQIRLPAEDNADTSHAEADTKPPSVTPSMLFKPLLKSRIVLARSFQLKGAGHVLLLCTLRRCRHSSGSCSAAPPTTRRRRLGCRLHRPLGVIAAAPADGDHARAGGRKASPLAQ